MSNLVIIPTYNEAENIAKIIPEILATGTSLHILVIDDGSPDGTADKVRSLQKIHPDRIFLLERSGKLGLGTAYVAGFQWALERNYHAVIEMDADFSHDPKMLPKFEEMLASKPVVVGSRYIPGGGTKNWGMIRKFISRFGSFYARNILALDVRDLTGGFNGYQTKVIKRINPSTIRSEGYSFQIELKYRAHLAGYNVVETPILFSERVSGVSKMSSKIVFEAMARVWWMRLNQSSFQRQLL